MSYRDWHKLLVEWRAEQRMLDERLAAVESDIEKQTKTRDTASKAKWVVSEVVRLTQDNVKAYIEELVTMALVAVFERDYKFIADFSMRDNRSQCVLKVQEGDWEPYIPKDDQGGGILDIISFALRVVLWSLEDPPSENFFYLDEPMKFVGSGTSEEVERAVEMLREVSEKLGIQLIINTHEAALAAAADRIFQVTHNGKKTTVAVIDSTSGKTSDVEVVKEERRYGKLGV